MYTKLKMITLNWPVYNFNFQIASVEILSISAPGHTGLYSKCTCLRLFYLCKGYVSINDDGAAQMCDRAVNQQTYPYAPASQILTL